jgi:hypothetical protein
MALLTDPDSLNQGTEVTISTGAKTIALNIAGTLSNDGVTLKCLYSFLKEEWKNDAALIKFPFPMEPITDEQFELKDGWNFANTGTRNLIRTGGWAVKNLANQVTEMWAGIVTLGSIEPDDQVYIQQANGAASTNIVLTGPVNQAVQIYSDPNGDGNTADGYDRRSYLKLFVREWQQSFASSALTDIGVAQMSYQTYRFPLTTAADLKVTHTESAVGTDAPYTGMSITYFATNQSRSIGGSSYNFRVIINGNNGTAEEIYEFVQRELRLATDIDDGAGSVTGKTANALLKFVGDTLITDPDENNLGVYIDNFNTADTNRITFNDATGTARIFPYVATLTINFGDNLKNDAAAIYRVFFTNDDGGDNTGRDYGTATALLVNDASAVPMSANVGGVSSITRSFAYDSNVQRGAASAGVDAPITVVAIGLTTGQFVKATGTIARSNANSVSLVASLERSYQNA